MGVLMGAWWLTGWAVPFPVTALVPLSSSPYWG